MSATRVLLVGAAGRMGQTIQALAQSSNDIIVAATVDIGDSLEPAIGNADVVIDFSQPDATAQICQACVKSRKPLVIGTTGHSRDQLQTIDDAAKRIAIVMAPNFSVGVNALFWLTRKAAELLGRDFDLEIVESHHRLKKDSPSGTAKKLAEILCEARRLDSAAHVKHGRKGLVGERGAAEIGVHSIRGGDVVGDHTVIFAGRGERIELTHRASSRETFAAGALRAARWIDDKPAGRYGMEDVLGLTQP